MDLVNRTPFKGAVFFDANANGVDTLVVTLKATYRFDEPELTLASVQNEPTFNDVYAGDPGSSSLLYESDSNWGRTGADVALLGYAYPRRDGETVTDISIRVGAAAKTARVFGERPWKSVVGSAQPGTPRPFERIALIYENAFGGIDDSARHPADRESEPRNPVGRGVRAKRGRTPLEALRPPNIEDPAHLISRLGDRPPPVGFTFVARGWQPRCNYAGTYDDAWQRERMPLLPNDFDSRFYTAASPGLTLPALQGGEPVELINITPARHTLFTLPRVDLQASFLVDAAPTPISLRLDTVVIDAAHAKLTLVWHGAQPVHGLIDDIHWVLAEGGPV